MCLWHLLFVIDNYNEMSYLITAHKCRVLGEMRYYRDINFQLEHCLEIIGNMKSLRLNIFKSTYLYLLLTCIVFQNILTNPFKI